jgi:hypothetical protein
MHEMAGKLPVRASGSPPKRSKKHKKVSQRLNISHFKMAHRPFNQLLTKFRSRKRGETNFVKIGYFSLKIRENPDFYAALRLFLPRFTPPIFCIPYAAVAPAAAASGSVK